MASSLKSQQLSVLQWEIEHIKNKIGKPDLSFTTTPALLKIVKSLAWEMTSNDAVNTRLNNFLLADDIMQEAMGAQSLYDLMHSNGASLSLDNAVALIKAKAGAPKMIFQACQQTCSYEIILCIVLGSQHTLPAGLSIYNARLSSSEAKIDPLLAKKMLLPTMLCKKIAVSNSNWFCNQASSPVPIQPPNYC